MNLEGEKMIELYRTMLRIRKFEEKVMDLYARQLIPGIVHLYIVKKRGHRRLRQLEEGRLHNIYSSWPWSLHCKGGELRFMMAELFGKTTGYCHGKGGSMHIANIDLGILGANGIVGCRHADCRWGWPFD